MTPDSFDQIEEDQDDDHSMGHAHREAEAVLVALGGVFADQRANTANDSTQPVHSPACRAST